MQACNFLTRSMHPESFNCRKSKLLRRACRKQGEVPRAGLGRPSARSCRHRAGRGGSSSKLRDFVSQTRQSSIEFRGWSCAAGIFRPVGPLESGSPSSKVCLLCVLVSHGQRFQIIPLQCLGNFPCIASSGTPQTINLGPQKWVQIRAFRLG